MRRATSVTISFLLCFLVLPHGALAEVTQVSVVVDGLSCPFCVFGVEKKLDAVAGVDGVEVDLKTGVATLRLEKGAVPDLAAVQAAVEKAGFTPREIRLTAVGTINVDRRKVHLDVRGAETRYLLSEDGGRVKATTRAELERRAEAGSVVAVTGVVQQRSDGSVALSIDKLEEVQEISLKVEGMSCDKCAARLTRLLGEAPGVSQATVDFNTGEARVQSRGGHLEVSPIISVVEDAGFTATQNDPPPQHP